MSFDITSGVGDSGGRVAIGVERRMSFVEGIELSIPDQMNASRYSI